MAPVAYLFFAFGALFGIHKISFVALFRDYSKWLLAAAIAALLYKCLCSISALEDITHGFLWDILGVAALLCAASFLYKPLFSSIFKESCFFLYAIHQQLIIYPLYYCFKTAGWEKNIWGVNGMFIITFIVSVAISILISYSFNRYCPKIHKILSGNR